MAEIPPLKMAEIGVLKGLLRKRNRRLAAYVFARQTTEIVLNVQRLV